MTDVITYMLKIHLESNLKTLVYYTGQLSMLH